MQNLGWRNPPVQDWGKTIPTPLRVDYGGPEHSAIACTREVWRCATESCSREQRGIGNNPARPSGATNTGVAIMHPALKLCLDGLELRDHLLLRSDPPYGEGSALVALPTVVSEARNVKVSGFPSPRCFRSRAANRPNSISRVLSGCNSKPNFASRSRNSLRNRSASVQC